MKCDELIPLVFSINDLAFIYEHAVQKNFENPHDHAFYKATEVDDAIAELKRKLQDQCISCPVKMQEDDVVAEKDNEIRRLKRALWFARANRAYVTTLLWNVYCYQNNCLYFRDFMNEKCNPFRNIPKKTAMEWSNLWESIETKCRAKAEEYK